MGSLQVPGSREQPPDGAVCTRAVRYLVRQRSRQKFRAGLPKELTLVVAPARGLLCGGARRPPPAAPAEALLQPLLQVSAGARVRGGRTTSGR
jgi:hypothetical protein